MRRVPVSFGASREATIESLDGEGRGIARVDGKVIFIEGALAGERVTYRSYMVKPTYEIARADDIFNPSSARVTPACAFFGVCGGCAMQHVEFRTQVAVKQRVLEDAFERIGKVTPEAMLAPIYGEPWGYRHRARLSSRLVPKKGGVLVGFRERHSSYVADMTDCRVLPPAVSALLMPLRTMIAGLSIAERMPQIEVAVGDRVIVLVLRILDPVSAADEALMRTFADSHGVQIWLQSKGPDTAQPFHPLDAPALDYSIPEFDVRIGFLPTDFTQVNHRVNQRLVARAVGLLAPAPGERIVDLFCGLGNFTLPIARSGARVDGFEGSPGLVQRARENAARNGIQADFAVANLFVSTEIPDLGQYAKLLIDPPREGAQELVKAIPETGGPQRIVYVSCDPATLARDAGVLVHTKGYRLVTAGIVNMFPQTAHVESIAMFER